jgi:hypothetical protein
MSLNKDDKTYAISNDDFIKYGHIVESVQPEDTTKK